MKTHATKLPITSDDRQVWAERIGVGAGRQVVGVFLRGVGRVLTLKTDDARVLAGQMLEQATTIDMLEPMARIETTEGER